MFLRKSAYRPKVPQSWFNDLRDYLAGRNPDLDKLFRWIEKQTSAIRPAACRDHDDLNKALEDWETSKRPFAEADGNLPEDSNERLAFIDMFPPDVSANVLKNMDMPGYETYDKIKRRRPRTGEHGRCLQKRAARTRAGR